MPLFSDVPCLSPTCGSRKQTPRLTQWQQFSIPVSSCLNVAFGCRWRTPCSHLLPPSATQAFCQQYGMNVNMPFFSVRGRKGREDPQEINNTKGGFPHTHISHLHEATQVCPPVFGTNHGSTMRSKMRQSCRRVRYWTTARVSYLAIIRFYYFSPHHHLLNIIQYFHVQYFH